MQSIFIDKKTKLVTAGMICPTGEKANPEDYPNDIIVYRAEGTYLDLNKSYKYVDGEFIAYTPKPQEVEPSPIEKLQKELKSTQQGMAEIMNLIAIQGIAPTE